MCIGDGNKKLQATIDIDTSSLGGLTDILNKQPTDTEVAAEETVEATEETTAPNLLNQPVLDKLEKMTENLPQRTTGETMRAMMPAIQQSDQMMHHMNRDQMRMLERIMQRTGRRPFNPRGPRGGSIYGKGGGQDRSRIGHGDPIRRQPLGTNPQVAGLAGLFGKQETPYNFGGAQRNPSLENIARFPKQQMATPMQPEVVEEQQEMEILGQPKQFAGGGIINALMATPVGQAAIQKYQEGGDIKFGDYVFDYKLTDDDPLDILRGLTYDDGRKARFYSSEAHMKDPSKPVVNWGRKNDIVEQITEDLTPQRRRKKKVEEQGGDDAGGSPVDPQAEVNVNQPTLMGPLGRGLLSLMVPGGGLLGALADQSAVSTALGKGSFAKSMQPTFMDHLLPGFLMDDDDKALYDKTVELMSYGNPYGRTSTLPGGAILHDYTHSYGDDPMSEEDMQSNIESLQDSMVSDPSSGMFAEGIGDEDDNSGDSGVAGEDTMGGEDM